jgi:hypothetical protein
MPQPETAQAYDPGSHTGDNRGVGELMRSHVELVEVAVDGPVQPVIKRIVSQHEPLLRRCDDAALQRSATAAGTVTWKGILKKDGVLAQGQRGGTLHDATASECVERTLTGAAYPTAQTDRPIEIELRSQIDSTAWTGRGEGIIPKQ